MTIYQVASTTFGCDVQLTFNPNGALIKYEVMQADIDTNGDNIRLHTKEADFLEIMKKFNMKVTKVHRKITFEMMWIRYNYKVDKALAMAEWNKMPEEEHTEAYDGVPAYEAHLKAHNIAKKYLVRYLKHKPYRDLKI